MSLEDDPRTLHCLLVDLYGRTDPYYSHASESKDFDLIRDLVTMYSSPYESHLMVVFCMRQYQAVTSARTVT